MAIIEASGTDVELPLPTHCILEVPNSLFFLQASSQSALDTRPLAGPTRGSPDEKPMSNRRILSGQHTLLWLLRDTAEIALSRCLFHPLWSIDTTP